MYYVQGAKGRIMSRADVTLQFRLPAQKKADFLAAVEAQPLGERLRWHCHDSAADVLRKMIDDYIEKHKPKEVKK